MKLRPRRSPRPRSPLPLIIGIVLIAVVVYRLDAFSGSGSGPVLPAPTPESARSAQDQTAAPTAQANAPPKTTSMPTPPTPAPTPTATPIPGPTKSANAAAPTISAVSAVAIDEKSGAIMFEKNPRLRRPPASVTKIITAIVAIERAKIQDMVDVAYDSSELIDSTLMGLYPNDKCSLEDLLYGLMLPSGNDAALAIANHVSGSKQDFVKLMNDKMRELGLEDSHFANPHGLDAADHYTSAYDLAMISRHGMQNDFFRKLAAAKSHPVTLWRQGERMSYDIFNLNRLLTLYPGADGIKIGFTENAGRTIVATATRNGQRVYVVLLGSSDLWTDSTLLFDYAFKNFTWPER